MNSFTQSAGAAMLMEENSTTVSLIGPHETPAPAAAPLSAPEQTETHSIAAFESPAREASGADFLSLQPLDFSLQTGLMQPVADLAGYLRTRARVAHYRDELALWLKLPSAVAREVRALLEAFDLVNQFRAHRRSVERACRQALVYFSTWNWKLKTFRAKYDLHTTQRDWFVLVNRAKCGGGFIERAPGLPDEFLRFVKMRVGEFGRADGMKQALNSIFNQWRTGLNHQGKAEVIPGYAIGWESRNPSLLSHGWTYSNIRRQLNRRDKLTKATRLLLHESTAAASAQLPQILGTRAAMRFMEEVTFDDLRFDYLIFNPDTGQAEELWALIARESSCRMVLGGVLFPATEREDGKVSHLGARQMKELAGQLLQTYPLPPYPITWKVERGTATLQEGVRAALGELFGRRINVSYTSMLGGTSPMGYREKAKGNSRGKGSHESHNRLFHTQGSFIPGQIGKNYEVRPADIKARIEECQALTAQRNLLPDHLRGAVKFPMLTLAEARQYFRKFSIEQNFRTDHGIEGFDEVLEWRSATAGDFGPWQSRLELPAAVDPKSVIWQKRKERPVERALRLIRSVAGWTPASPAVVIAFLEHTQKRVEVLGNGEIEMTVDGQRLVFRNGGVPLTPGTKALAYLRPDEPNFLHLTDGRGAVLGTWVNRVRVRHNDREALAEAMRYTHAAKAAAKAEANQLAAPRREELEALRAHNAQLNEFIEVTTPPSALGPRPSALSPVGAALTAVSAAVKSDARRAREHAADLRRFTGDVGELAEEVVTDAQQRVLTEEDFSADALL